LPADEFVILAQQRETFCRHVELAVGPAFRRACACRQRARPPRRTGATGSKIVIPSRVRTYSAW